MDSYYFLISGFYFCISFHDTEWINSKEKTKKEILDYLHNFATLNKPKKINYFIDFIWDDKMNVFVLYKNSGKTENRLITLYFKKGTNKIISFYRISIIEFQKLLSTALVELLLKHNGIMLHASSVAYNNHACIFLGESGVGKSTLIDLLKENFLPLEDDTVIIKNEYGKYYLYQTPFLTKNSQIKKYNKRYILDKIYFLKQATNLKISKIRTKEYIIKLLIKNYFQINNIDEKINLKQLFDKFNIKEEILKRNVKNILKLSEDYDKFYTLYFVNDKNKLLNFFRSVSNITS